MSSLDRKTETGNIKFDEISVMQVLKALRRRKFFILGMTAASVMLAVVIAFSLPKTYTAEAVILPTSNESTAGAFAAGLASQFGAAAGMLSGLGLGSNKATDLVEILKSRSMTERVIAKLQLDHQLTGWKTKGELIDKVKKLTSIESPTLDSKVIRIHTNAPIAELSANMANAYASELKEMLDQIGYNSAAKNRQFIERQLQKTKGELSLAEEKLAQFQANNQIASLPETILASIRTISELEAQNINTEVQIRSTDEVLSTLTAKVSELQAAPDAMVDLELKRTGLSAQREALRVAQQAFLQKLTNLPPKAMDLARMQRDVQVQNAIYLALTQQYETSMISESKESDAFLVLDRAYTPEKPSKPQKALVVLGGAIVGLLLGILLTLWKEFKRPYLPQ